ncbi:MAG TPA: iron-sulfur cluster assembly accessory protein [Gemmatimonadota bacterium]|nr:iron-sulfur cluster assembly accessory protein [Gemmatimonadota bacterium]
MIRFTDAARERVLAYIEEEGREDLAIRIGVRKSSPFAPEYDLALVGPDEVSDQDASFDQGGFRLYAERQSLDFLEGSEIDWVESLQGSGFKVQNPNVKPLGAEPPEGPLAERVQTILQERINPGVASHGGHVSLVDIRDRVVYLKMGGGCQGCGMASVTLTRGIKEALRAAVPEIEGVEDVTDHSAGTNPYYN